MIELTKYEYNTLIHSIDLMRSQHLLKRLINICTTFRTTWHAFGQIVVRFFMFLPLTNFSLLKMISINVLALFLFVFFRSHCPRCEYFLNSLSHNFLANSIDSKRSHENNWLWFVGRRWSLPLPVHHRIDMNLILNELVTIHVPQTAWREKP